MSKDVDDFELDDDTRIIKVRRDQGFTMVPNEYLNDIRLSVNTMAVLVYVMSKPEGYKMHIDEISQRFKIETDDALNLMQALRDLNYLG